jgi:hypothetical protein
VLRRFNMVFFGADIVVNVVDFLVFDEDRIAASVAAMGDEHAFGTALGISTSAVKLCARFRTFTATFSGTESM